MPPAIREEIALLRESFQHSAPLQDWVAQWWGRLPLNDRRLLLALSGLDDSAEAASRHWLQLLQEHRDTVLKEAKRFLRMVEGLRWA